MPDNTTPHPPEAAAAAKAAEAAAAKAKVDTEKMRPFWSAVAATIVFSLFFVFLVPFAWFSVVLALLALGSLSAGGVAGFLFGIPQKSALGTPAANGAAAASDEGSYRPSNSLEQISDWLTKIIVGVGLVEFNEVENRLAALGRLVAGSKSGQSLVVPQLVVVLFAALGFAAAYMWTRLSYATVQTLADSSVLKLWREVRALQTTQTQQGNTMVELNQNQQNVQPLSAATATENGAAGPPAPEGARGIPRGAPSSPAWLAWQEKLDQFMAAPPKWDEDTTATIFEVNAKLLKVDKPHGRQLKVNVISTTPQELFFKALVSGTPELPLSGKIIFLFHPSYGAGKAQEAVVRYGKDTPGGYATISFYAADGFTLVAMTDAGETVLGYDLQPFFDK